MKPDDIPEDVHKTAFEVARAVGAGLAIGSTETIARAILAERARWEAEVERLREASIWQRSAMDETIRQIHASVGLTETEYALGDDAIIAHIDGMPARMESDFDAARLGRWLGWTQGVACAKGWLTLEGCKLINKQASAAIYKPNTVSGERE